MINVDCREEVMKVYITNHLDTSFKLKNRRDLPVLETRSRKKVRNLLIQFDSLGTQIRLKDRQRFGVWQETPKSIQLKKNYRKQQELDPR